MKKIVWAVILVGLLSRAGQADSLKVGRVFEHGDKQYLVLMFEKDKWFGLDKLEHFAAGYMLETGFELAGMKKHWALVTTIALAGFYEWYDMERGVGFSYKDFLWSSAGAITSYLINKKLLKK